MVTSPPKGEKECPALYTLFFYPSTLFLKPPFSGIIEERII
jgi:hypothetical protein